MLPGLMELHSDGTRCAIGSGIQGALAGLVSVDPDHTEPQRHLGGQITFFLTSLPNFGPGKLTARDDTSIYGTDKEKLLFSPSDAFWRNTAESIAESGIGVNTFLFPDQYIDIASVGALSGLTGGETFFHPRFEPVRDGDILFDEIRRSITSELVYNATLRVRCSNNLRVGDHYGNFYQRSLTDLEFGTMHEGAAVGAVIRHEGKLDERELSYIQVAVLYTSASGERRVRVLNMSMGVTGLIGNVYRFADLDAAVTLYAKEGACNCGLGNTDGLAVSNMGAKSLKEIRKSLGDRCNRVLAAYRKHCAPAVGQGQVSRMLSTRRPR
jgi:protein transport protein SEC24